MIHIITNAQTGEVTEVPFTQAEIDALKPSKEQAINQYQDQIQQRLDTFAQERGYNGILSACTYATSNVPKFSSEGQRCVDLRDATWGKAYEIMQAIKDDVPTWEQVEAQLPALTWGE
jgi:hypothetical protein